MSKWRPSPTSGLYVIADIRARFACLDQIFSRILPLRKSAGIKDHLVCLGGYLGPNSHAPRVVEACLQLQCKQPTQTSFLRNKSENVLLQILGRHPCAPKNANLFPNWLLEGGYQILSGYADFMGRSLASEELLHFPVERVGSLIPENHVQFLINCQDSCQIDSYYFGSETESELIRVVGTAGIGQNYPIVQENYLNLDYESGLLVTELNSLEAKLALPTKNKLFEFDLIPEEA